MKMSSSEFRKAIPWWVRVVAKLVLSRAPIPYGIWRRLGYFRHGDMHLPERAVSTFKSYFDLARDCGGLPDHFSSLELGPGDSVLSGIVAKAFGAERIWLLDAEAFASDTPLDSCFDLARLLGERGLNVPDFSNATTLHAVLSAIDCSYLTAGTQSFEMISDGAVDFVWSQAVLEHVHFEEFSAFLRHLRRIASPRCVGIHTIDFRDHLGGGLNNLRFGDAVWESNVFRRSGFYTNRIRPSEMLKMFECAGFELTVLSETRWPNVPINRAALSSKFASLPDEDLQIAELVVAIRPF